MVSFGVQICLLVTLLSISFKAGSSELFTAIVDLEKLLETEKSVSHLLQNYLRSEEERLGKIRLFRDSYLKLQQVASQDTESYLSNPVNAYLLVKRLTTDWKTIENLVVSGPTETGRAAFANLSNALDIRSSFPSAEDLSGAADALIRLQDTYRIDTSSIAKGNITAGRSPNTKVLSTQLELSAGDCFELGKHAYSAGDHYHTVLWMREALDRLSEETLKTIELHEILEYLAFSTYQEGNVREALRLTNQLLHLVPTHERAVGNKVYYENVINKSDKDKMMGDDGKNVPVDNFVRESKPEDTPESDRSIYESLCRGEKRISPKTESQLKCYFWDTRKSPFLRLTRIKTEEAFLKPHLLIFYEVLTPNEMRVIREMAGPRLKRATVQNYKTGELETAQYRISKSAWLKDGEDEVIRRVNQRIAAITGLSIATAEELQVVNYGIGGHYEAHFDFARREEKNAFKHLGTGNRIATWLNYMSDVEAGGATVFPAIGVSLWPTKGSAAFWYNLHKNGEGDMLTRHAACPVLLGSKWVSNKWFHEMDQEFRRPCGLRINE